MAGSKPLNGSLPARYANRRTLHLQSSSGSKAPSTIYLAVSAKTSVDLFLPSMQTKADNLVRKGLDFCSIYRSPKIIITYKLWPLPKRLEDFQ